jgi:hypothetical protein
MIWYGNECVYMWQPITWYILFKFLTVFREKKILTNVVRSQKHMCVRGLVVTYTHTHSHIISSLILYSVIFQFIKKNIMKCIVSLWRMADNTFFCMILLLIYMCLCLVIKMNCMYTWWVDCSMSDVNCFLIVPSCCWRGFV